MINQENKAPEALPQEKIEIQKPQNEKPNNNQPIPAGNDKVDEPATPEDPNWRAFREARKKDRAEREAAENKAKEKEAEVAALKAAMEVAFAKSPALQYAREQYSEEQGSSYEETEDERIEKKVQAAIAKREAEYIKQQQEREHQEYPVRLTKTYSDFNQTIAQENLDYLDFHYPEVSIPLQRLPDGYDKWSDIYKAVKKFVPNNQGARKDAAKADANFNKPKSMSAASITQPGEPTGSARLTEERRAENWARMQKVLKGVS